MDDRVAPAEYRFETPPRHEDLDAAALREAYGPIRGHFRYHAKQYDDLRDAVDGARLGVTVDAYLARSARLAGYAALVGAAVGLVVGLLAPTIASIPRLVVAAVGLGAGVVLGGGGTWLARRWYPRLAAIQRARRVNLLFPHATIFCYALVHGGVDLRTVLARLAGEADVYGTVADEFGVVAADIESFNRSLSAALAAARRRTRSEDFETFLDELVSVLEAGGGVESFLSAEAQRHLELAHERQTGLLEDLSSLAEVYTAVVFAGPIFLLVVLIVVSFSTAGLLHPMEVLVYVVVPLLLVGFWAALDYLMEPYRQHMGVESALVTSPRGWVRSHFGVDPAALPVVGDALRDGSGRSGEDGLDGETDPSAAGVEPATDGESADGGEASADGTGTDDRFEAYRASQRRSSLERLRSAPLDVIGEYPAASLFVSVPLGAAVAVAFVLAGRVGVRADPIGATVWLFAVPFLLAAVPFSVLYERKRRYDRTVRDRFPAALEILADADENDLPLGDALRLVSRRTSGVLETEFTASPGTTR